MPRFLLALSLLAFMTTAMATEPSAAEDPQAKPGKAAVAPASEGDAPATPPAVAPTPRTGSAVRPAVPRWHSLLPGMIR